jgi:hypothetical protein
MGYDAFERSDGAINMRMRDYEGLIKVGVSTPTEMRASCASFLWAGMADALMENKGAD